MCAACGIRIRAAVFAVAVALAPAFAAVPARAQTDVLEWAVKAAYLPKFVSFVAWPSGVFDGPRAPLRICVQGADPFGDLLDRAVAGEVVDGHPLVVRRIAVFDPTAGCHLLYAGGSPAQSRAEALRLARGAPVLTVTSGMRGATPRGILHFVLIDNRVRFEIDAAGARQSALAISSKLQDLGLGTR